MSTERKDAFSNFVRVFADDDKEKTVCAGFLLPSGLVALPSSFVHKGQQLYGEFKEQSEVFPLKRAETDSRASYFTVDSQTTLPARGLDKYRFKKCVGQRASKGALALTWSDTAGKFQHSAMVLVVSDQTTLQTGKKDVPSDAFGIVITTSAGPRFALGFISNDKKFDPFFDIEYVSPEELQQLTAAEALAADKILAAAEASATAEALAATQKKQKVIDDWCHRVSRNIPRIVDKQGKILCTGFVQVVEGSQELLFVPGETLRSADLTALFADFNPNPAIRDDSRVCQIRSVYGGIDVIMCFDKTIPNTCWPQPDGVKFSSTFFANPIANGADIVAFYWDADGCLKGASGRFIAPDRHTCDVPDDAIGGPILSLDNVANIPIGMCMPGKTMQCFVNIVSE